MISFILYLQRFLLIVSLVLWALFSRLEADENWSLCRVPTYSPVPSLINDGLPSEIEAESVTRSEDNILHFSGQVQLRRGSDTIRADELIIDKQTERLHASGQVIFESPAYRLQTDSLTLNQKSEAAKFGASEFQLPERHARGSASAIEKFDTSHSRFKNFLYTSCDPENSDWRLTGGQLDIDQESGRGSAKHATLYFKGIPVFYLPYIMFPIDDRRMSGILNPLLSYSDEGGSGIAIPFYWNIAPNTDATITPAWFSERGLQITTENRYLFDSHQGQIDLSYLNDDLFNDRRWKKKWQHQATLGFNIGADLLLQEVSDDLFFHDFDLPGSDNEDINHLERHIRLTQTTESWQTGILWQDYQTLDLSIAVDNQPYRRLPRITLNSLFDPFENNLAFESKNEWVKFDHESLVTGSRLHLLPSVAWLKTDGWYFFKPKLELALTEYQLDNNSPFDNSISRSLPILSLDTGLIFERSLNNNDWIQTLEPRLFFLHVPFEDQTGIPDFDSARLIDSYSNFFRTNRFSGADRIGDARQVTIGLSSRILARDTGREIMNARLAQIYYFEDRLVSLDGFIESQSKSNVIAELDLSPTTGLKIGGKLVYDEQSNELFEKNLSINYANNGFAVNTEYYFTDQELEQAAISLVYPVNNRWTIFAKYHESLLFDKPVENLIGLSYESCCWGIKILASQTSDDDFLVTDNAVYFEVTFKGLSQAGRDIDTQLAKAIPGYQARF